MMNSDLFVEVRLYESEVPHFEFESNVKDECLLDLIYDVVSARGGIAADKSEPEKRDVYTMRIDWDLSDDSRRLVSNTGNTSVTTGMLIGAMEFLKERTKG